MVPSISLGDTTVPSVALADTEEPSVALLGRTVPSVTGTGSLDQRQQLHLLRQRQTEIASERVTLSAL